MWHRSDSTQPRMSAGIAVAIQLQSKVGSEASAVHGGSLRDDLARIRVAVR